MKDFPPIGQNRSKNKGAKASSGTSKSGIRLWIAWTVLFLVAAFFVRQRVEYLRVERRIRSLMEQKQKLTADILPLKLEESYLTQIGRIEALSEKMGLGPAAEWQKLALHGAKPLAVENLAVRGEASPSTQNAQSQKRP